MSDKNDPDSKLEEAFLKEKGKRLKKGKKDLDENEIHLFSIEFQRKIEKLMQEENKRASFRSEKEFTDKLVLSSFLLFIFALVGAAAGDISMESVNRAIWGSGNHSETRMVNNAEYGIREPVYLDELYEPRKIPKWYERIREEEKPAYYEVNYAKDWKVIRYRQSAGGAGTEENEEYGRAVKIKSESGTYYFYNKEEEKGSHMLAWSEGMYRFQIVADIDVNAMIQMAKSVEEIRRS